MTTDKVQQYRKQFCIEVREILETLSQDILKAEADPEDKEILNTCFRGVHTIKGSAGTFKMDAITHFTHHMEEMMNAVRDEKLFLDAELVDLFLEGMDHIDGLLFAFETGREIHVDEDLVRRFCDVCKSPEIDPINEPMDRPPTPLETSAAFHIDEIGLAPEIIRRFNALAADGFNVFKIGLRYTSEHLVNGYDPLPFLMQLKSKSELYHVHSNGPDIPALEKFDPYALYLTSDLIVASGLSIEKIADLTFDPDLISITPLEAGPDQEEDTFVIPPSIDAQSMREFIVGSFEMLDTAEDAAIRYESSADPKALNEIFRVVHNIKGDSDYIGIETLARFSHELESMLERLRSGLLEKNPDIVEIILRSLDHLKLCIQKIEHRQNPPDAPAISKKIRVYIDRQPSEQPEKEPEIEFFFLKDEDEKQIFSEQLHQYRDIILRNVETFSIDNTSFKVVIRALRSMKNASLYVGCPELVDMTETALNAGEFEFDAAVENTLDMLIKMIGGRRKSIENIDEPKRIGQILMADGIISEQDLSEGLSSQKRIGEILKEKGKITEDDLQSALKKQLQIDIQDSPKSMPEEAGRIRTMRVDEAKVDGFSNLAGELLIARNTYEYLLDTIQSGRPITADESKALRENLHLFSRLANDIHYGIMSLRMIPIGGVFRKFSRMVRDISRKQNKFIELKLEGEDIEIDKKAADVLADPLVHLVRNACDHGLESPAERFKAGKPDKGKLILKAAREGSRIKIIIKDDGSGISREELRRKAESTGIPTEDMTDRDLLELILLPGFSTRSKATDISGRGVGMDVVNTSIKSLGGNTEISSEPGAGTEIVLNIPMTMGIENALLIESNERLYALPLSSIIETLKISPEKIHRHGKRMFFYFRGKVLALETLESLLNENDAIDFTTNIVDDKRDENGDIPVVIAQTAHGGVGIIVNSFRKNMEIAVKPMPKLLMDIDYASGVSIMGDGRVILLINPGKI